MLYIFSSLRQLQFSSLMCVYANAASPDDAMPMNAEQNFYAGLRDFFSVPGAFYAVWAPEKRYKAALRIEPYAGGLLLSCLATAPQERRKGYATALMKAVLTHLKASAPVRLYSHIALANKASLAVHKACGFRMLSESARLLDGSVLPEMATYYIDIT